MRIVTSKFRIILFLTALYGVVALLFDPVLQQYDRLYQAVLNFGLIEFLFNRTGEGIGIPVGDRGSITGFVFAVAKTIEFGVYQMIMFFVFVFFVWPTDRKYDEDDPEEVLNEFEYHFGEFTLDVTGDERMSYDDDITYALFFPGYLLAAVLGYLSVFMTWMVILTVNVLVTEILLALLRSLPFVRTQSSDGGAGSSTTSDRRRQTGRNSPETNPGSNNSAENSRQGNSDSEKGIFTQVAEDIYDKTTLLRREKCSSEKRKRRG